ncbi:hypothetical protein [Brevundimonas fluminis]|jgi:uncharacterized PurR-regulated membrane protein YhhQ (DUF165 family)|uniref:hypothetical protein n=1 Tax=Brevundimonas fluminis TaxID=2487274 RepID=UPI000F6572A0|nr:hypothetical protein [Brevundimonas fluminis]
MVTTDDLNRLWGTLRLLGWGAVALVMAAPAVAMALGAPGVNWTAADFIFAGVLLIGGGAIIELVAWRVKNPAIRIGFALLVVAAVALVWIEAAVGIFH